MGKIRQSAYVLLTVVAFIILSVVAAVEYSGNKDKADNVKNGALYKTISLVLQKTELFLSAPLAIKTGTEVASEAIKIEEKNRLLDRTKKYIQVQKTDAGWEITLQNSKGIVFQKTF